jgi:hypothetical protein
MVFPSVCSSAASNPGFLEQSCCSHCNQWVHRCAWLFFNALTSCPHLAHLTDWIWNWFFLPGVCVVVVMRTLQHLQIVSARLGLRASMLPHFIFTVTLQRSCFWKTEAQRD